MKIWSFCSDIVKSRPSARHSRSIYMQWPYGIAGIGTAVPSLGQGASVCIVDTLVDADSPALVDTGGVEAWSPHGEVEDVEREGRGTAMAGLVAGEKERGTAMAGERREKRH